MQLITLDSGRAKQLFWSVVVAAGAVCVFTTRQTDPVQVGAAVLLIIVGMTPFYIWLLRAREGLPLWPAYSLYSCILAALPVLQKAQALERFAESSVLHSLFTLVGFFTLGTIIWMSISSRAAKPPPRILMLESDTAVRSLILCISAGALFQLNSLTGWIHFPGNTMQVARGVSGGLSFLGIFAMAYFHGRGFLSKGQVAIYLALTLVLTSVALTGLLIANIIQPIALALIGYTLGASRPPWAVLGVVFALIGVLHAGKYTMRDLYGINTERPREIGISTLPSFYSEWLSYGFGELGGLAGTLNVDAKEDSPTTVFERSGNLHLLVLVQTKSPTEVPYLDGITYAPIPQMLLPRFLVPNKAISHTGNILLAVNYGLVDEEGARNVSIGWTYISEAYANFGYLGLFGMCVLLSVFYSLMARLSSRVPITSFRFVTGLVVLASIPAENTLGVAVGAQFQAIVGVALASFFLMRRQPNPFAAREGAEEQWQTAEGIRRQKAEGMTGARDQETKRPKDEGHQAGPAKWGGHKPPKWAPLSHRKAYELAAARRKAETATDAADEKNADEGKAQRPRQVAVPIQPYYYRSRKA